MSKLFLIACLAISIAANVRLLFASVAVSTEQTSAVASFPPVQANCNCPSTKAAVTAPAPHAPPKPPALRSVKSSTFCDGEKEKSVCALALAKEQAERDVDLGNYNIEHQHLAAAYQECQEGLKLSPSLPTARSCVDTVIHELQTERRATLFHKLSAVDARLYRGHIDEALSEIDKIDAELEPTGSPLGVFDGVMDESVESRWKIATILTWLSWILTELPVVFWVMVKALAALFAVIVCLVVLRSAWKTYKRHTKYKNKRLKSPVIEWNVWSIQDKQNRGAAGPVMDALNTANNPLLSRQFIPSSLLLVPSFALNWGTESLVWRDFLDRPREPIDMEVLPLKEFQKHRFIQVEAFDELDVKVAGVEAKGLIGLFRTLRKLLDRGLPAAQGIVYRLRTGGATPQSYACVRITCNWTADVKALTRNRKRHHRSDDEDDRQDETVSVFASTADDLSIDAIALSAQRAAFKLFHRLALRSSSAYATAVANFHQGVELIDQSL
jgi:hypothetical protein